MKVGALVHAARKRVGMTLTELGERVGASASSLSALENDQRVTTSLDELISISDALMDKELLAEFCNNCPMRDRISIKKFRPLNNIVPGAIPAMIKTTQKIALASEALNSMMVRLCNKNFREDPEYEEFKREVYLRLIEAMNGLEIVVAQSEAEGVISHDEYLDLRALHRSRNVQKGHHMEKA